MRILALDLGTRTGFCRIEATETTTDQVIRIWHRGVRDFTPESREEPEGVRFRRFADWLRGELQELRASDFVVFEDPPFLRGRRASAVLDGMVALLTVECERRGLSYIGVSPVDLKMHSTGKGNAKKDAMIEAASRLLRSMDMDPGKLTHDEADAVLLARYALDNFVAEEAA